LALPPTDLQCSNGGRTKSEKSEAYWSRRRTFEQLSNPLSSGRTKRDDKKHTQTSSETCRMVQKAQKSLEVSGRGHDGILQERNGELVIVEWSGAEWGMIGDDDCVTTTGDRLWNGFVTDVLTLRRTSETWRLIKWIGADIGFELTLTERRAGGGTRDKQSGDEREMGGWNDDRT
jgi:hypothetical protein